jgi:hypothetical protein
VERREARVPRRKRVHARLTTHYGTQGASQAPGRTASWCAQPGAAAPGRLSALRPPLDRGGIARRSLGEGGYKFTPRAQSRRGNEWSCPPGLFEIVSRNARDVGSAFAVRGFASRPMEPATLHGTGPNHCIAGPWAWTMSMMLRLRLERSTFSSQSAHVRASPAGCPTHRYVASRARPGRSFPG